MKKISVLLSVLFAFLIFSVPVRAETLTNDIEIQKIQEAFEDATGGEVTFSLSEYLDKVQAGEESFSFRTLFQEVIHLFQEQWEAQSGQLIRLFLLGILAGIFTNFSEALGRKELGETGFFVVYLLLFTTITTGFFDIMQVANETLENLLVFMKVLVPSFAVTVAAGAQTATATGFYEMAMIGMTFVEIILVHILIPVVNIYFLLSLANQLTREGRFSKMAELIHSFLRWTVKALFGVVVGFQGIQMLILPVADKVKQSAVTKTVSSLPGVGNTFGSVAETVLGTTSLIKSVAGVGGVIGICVICAIPLLKILIFVLTYKVSAAFIQPVSDRRIVKSMNAVAESSKILFSIVAVSGMLFLCSIAIVLWATNR